MADTEKTNENNTESVPVFNELTRVQSDENAGQLFGQWGAVISRAESVFNGIKTDLENDESFITTALDAIKDLYGYKTPEQSGSPGVNQLPDPSVEDALASIFGMPYQFSEIVDPPYIYKSSDGKDKRSTIGNKFLEKIFLRKKQKNL